MNYNAEQIVNDLRKMEKTKALGFRQREMVEATRKRLEAAETAYRSAINAALGDLEDVGVKL